MTLPVAASAAAEMDQDRVYVPLRDGRLIAVDREHGSVSWSQAAHAVAPPVVDGTSVYLLQSDSVRALDAATGGIRWTARLDREPLSPLRLVRGLLTLVVAPAEVVAFHSQNGELAWRRQLDAPSTHAPVAGTTLLYVASTNGRLSALSVQDGSVRWERNVPGTPAEPGVGTNRVYVGSTDNWLYAFDAESGDTRWRVRGGADVIGTVADNDLVYVVTLDNVVRALNERNGNQRWKQETVTRPTLPPMTRRGLVVVPGLTPAATVFNGRTGEARGSLTVAQGSLFGPPLIDPSLTPFRVAAVTLTREGVLEARRPVTMMFRESGVVGLPSLPGRQLPREQLLH